MFVCLGVLVKRFAGVFSERLVGASECCKDSGPSFFGFETVGGYLG